MKLTNYDVVVLGGGAAGLMCAITAGARGRRVLVLERSNKPGKKILMSGGGRCNFTNLWVLPENFISSNPHFCKSAISQYTQWDFIGLVEAHDIEYEERSHGQLFCVDSAKQILAMLLAECARVNVEILNFAELQEITPVPETNGINARYELMVKVAGDEIACISASSVVVATGALSIPTLGGSGQGYELATQFDLELKPRRAGLVPLMFSDQLKSVCERLSGTSLEVTISCGGQTFTESLLFTHRGISGPAVLQISSYWSPGETVHVDLFNGLDASMWLLEGKRDKGLLQIRSLLSQRLPRSLVDELQALWWPTAAGKRLADCPNELLNRIGTQLNNWQLKPSASEGYRTAEVTLGGVATDNISSKSMEVRQQPGLFFIGEVLDVSGHLGGFNFQWAWSSGYCAGLSA